MRRLLGLALVAIGWVLFRKRQQGASPDQILQQGRGVLEKATADLRTAAGQARERAGGVVEQVRASSADQSGRAGSSGAPAGTAATGAVTDAMGAAEHPPDGPMVVGEAPYPPEAFPEVEPPEAPSPTYGAIATGPEDASAQAEMAAVVPPLDDDLRDPLESESVAPRELDVNAPGATITGADVVVVPDTADTGDASEPSVRRAGHTDVEATDVLRGDATEAGTYGSAESVERAGDDRVETVLVLDGSERADVVIAPERGDAGGTVSVSDSTTLPTEETASFPEMEPGAGASAGEAERSMSDAPDESGASAEEGLLLPPEGGSTTTSPDAEQPVAETDIRRIEGGSGQDVDRIYPATGGDVAGPDDTEDTAREIGLPGPVATARREELQSVDFAPDAGMSMEDYQHVEVSLPPETLAAMQQSEQGDGGVEMPPVREGYDVEAVDGKVGAVDSVVSPSGRAEGYFVVKEGLIFKHDVRIPFSAIARVEGHTVYLNIDKQYIDLLEGEHTKQTGFQGGPTLT